MVSVDDFMPISAWTTLTGLSGLKINKQVVMKGGHDVRRERAWGKPQLGRMRGGNDQDVLHTCMKFSKDNKKLN